MVFCFMDCDILHTVCFHARYFVFLTVYFIFEGLFYLHSEQVDGNTVVCTLGKAARRSNVSDYVYRRHQQGLTCSCLTDKQSCKHIENAH